MENSVEEQIAGMEREVENLEKLEELKKQSRVLQENIKKLEVPVKDKKSALKKVACVLIGPLLVAGGWMAHGLNIPKAQVTPNTSISEPNNVTPKVPSQSSEKQNIIIINNPTTKALETSDSVQDIFDNEHTPEHNITIQTQVTNTIEKESKDSEKAYVTSDGVNPNKAYVTPNGVHSKKDYDTETDKSFKKDYDTETDESFKKDYDTETDDSFKKDYDTATDKNLPKDYDTLVAVDSEKANVTPVGVDFKKDYDTLTDASKLNDPDISEDLDFGK